MISCTSARYFYAFLPLALILLTSCTPSVSSSLTPSPVPTVYEMSTIVNSLENACGVTFKEDKAEGTSLSVSGEDKRGLLQFDLASKANSLTQAKVVISGLDNSQGWVWYDSYVHDCALAMLQPLGLDSLLIWYEEQMAMPSADLEVANVQANTRDEGQYSRSLTLTFGASSVPSSEEAASSESPMSCGEGMIRGLGGVRLNIRINPGLDQEIIGKAQEGDTVLLGCEEQEKDGIMWIKITIQDITGWVSKEYVAST